MAHQNALHTPKKGDMYPGRVIFGLIACCIGDYFLTSEQTFLPGVGAFAVGHVFYIRYVKTCLNLNNLSVSTCRYTLSL